MWQIHDDKVTFRDASSIWNLSSAIDVGKILREIEARGWQAQY